MSRVMRYHFANKSAYVNRCNHFLKWNGEVRGLSIPTYCTSGKIFMFMPSSELIKRAGGVRRAGGGAVYIPQGPRRSRQRSHCRRREKNNTLGTDKTSLFTTWPTHAHNMPLYGARNYFSCNLNSSVHMVSLV